VVLKPRETLNKIKLNEWLTLTANFGVLLGIFFLAYEINLSRTVALAEIYQGRAHTRSEASLQIALSSSQFVEADLKFQELLEKQGVASAVAQLTQEERYLLSNWHSSLMIRFDNVAFQYQQGLIPDAYYETTKRGLQRFMPIWRELGIEIPDTSRELFESIEKEGT
jgi:hypothetical protein